MTDYLEYHVYSNTNELPAIKERVRRDWAMNPYTDGTTPRDGVLCQISSIQELGQHRKRVNLDGEKDHQQLASAIRNASVFYFGGLFDDSLEFLGPPLGRIQGFLNTEKQEAFKNTLAFCPKSARTDRIDAAYDWNADQTFPVDVKATSGDVEMRADIDQKLAKELKSVADALWENRFLDERGQLLRPEQFKGFNVITYSIGGRMAFMVENLLRQKLRVALRARNGEISGPEAFRAENRTIQQYFDRCRIVSIGHTVDWHGFKANVPGIPKHFLIGKDDVGPTYHKDFLDFMLGQDCGGHAGKTVDIADRFGGRKGQYRVTILDDGVLRDVKSSRDSDNSHGLRNYLNAASKYRHDSEVAPFVQAINNAVMVDSPARYRINNGPDGSGRRALP